MLLYFAAPLFCQAELEFNRVLTEKIEDLGLSVFLPQRDGAVAEYDPNAIFQMDKKRLVESDIFLYVLDGRVPDEGAAVALGLVYMYKEESQKDIHIVGLHTDKRSAYLNEKLNPMISSALDVVFESEEALFEYIGDLVDEEDKELCIKS